VLTGVSDHILHPRCHRPYRVMMAGQYPGILRFCDFPQFLSDSEL